MRDWRAQLGTLKGAYSDNTIRAYAADFAAFEAWCQEQGFRPLPASPEALADYVAALGATYAPASIRRFVTGISKVHRMLEEADPGSTEVVRMALRRLFRARGRRQKQAAGLRSDLRDALIGACGDGLRGARDRALIAVGYDTLCRRSELIELRAEDIVEAADGSGTVLVRRSKADQLGDGRLAYLSPRSVAFLSAWLDAAGISDGPIFRSIHGPRIATRGLCGFSVTRIVKDRAQAAGLPPDLVARLSGHSFRIGAALDMTEHGIDLVPIMHAGGWKSAEMVIRYTQQISTMRSGMALLYKRTE